MLISSVRGLSKLPDLEKLINDSDFNNIFLFIDISFYFIKLNESIPLS